MENKYPLFVLKSVGSGFDDGENVLVSTQGEHGDAGDIGFEVKEKKQKYEILVMRSTSPSGQVYKILPNFLDASGVSPFNRSKLKYWLSKEMHSRQFNRITYAYCSKYLDMYLSSLNKPFPINSLQNLGISCWILASKIQQSKVPMFSYQKQCHEEIRHFEKDVCRRLQFRMHPLTYTYLMENLLLEWNDFMAKRSKKEEHLLSAKSEQCLQFIQVVFECLDCIDLTPNSYQFSLQELTLFVFFLSAKQMYARSAHRTSAICCQFEQENATEFDIIFDFFLKHLSENNSMFSDCKISPECRTFVAHFMLLKLTRPVIDPHSHHSIQASILLHTHNKEAYQVACNYIKKFQSM